MDVDNYLHEIDSLDIDLLDIQSDDEDCWVPLAVSVSEESEDETYSPKDKPSNTSILKGATNLPGLLRAGHLMAYYLYRVLLSWARYFRDKLHHHQHTIPFMTPKARSTEIENETFFSPVSTYEAFFSPENVTQSASEAAFLLDEDVDCVYFV